MAHGLGEGCLSDSEFSVNENVTIFFRDCFRAPHFGLSADENRRLVVDGHYDLFFEIFELHTDVVAFCAPDCL